MAQCMNTVYMHSKFIVGCDHVINECCTGSMISLPEFHLLSIKIFFTNAYPIVHTQIQFRAINMSAGNLMKIQWL